MTEQEEVVELVPVRADDLTAALAREVQLLAEIERQKAVSAQRSVRIYIDTHDWWVGYYRGDSHHYVCLLPCVVIRWSRRVM